MFVPTCIYRRCFYFSTSTVVIFLFVVCDCVIEGSQTSPDNLALCDKLTGECMCLPNAEGRRCDQCKVTKSQ